MTRQTLPSQQNPIIGREAELADVANRLADPGCRILNIIGPGGVGKTRLAIEAAAQTKDQFADGVFFVDLQPVSEENFFSAFADAIGLSLSGREPPGVQLIGYLRDKDALVLLDNFEHLLSKATFLSQLLSQAPSVNLLVTSRETINLQQEWLYPLRGLPVPPDPEAEDFANYGAVQLFQECARRVSPDFSLDENRGAVIRICHLVEGLPLALELAAFWTRTLSCDEIADEIERNLEFLSWPLRDIPKRHRSMQVVFDQMWAMLPEEERCVFQRLSVFRGEFQREAAEAVAGATLSILSTLVDKCMLRRERGYHIHELLRQFGEEKLQRSPEEAETVRRRHIEYYADFLHRRIDAIHNLFQRQAVIEIAEEWDNVRAAWRRAIADGNLEAIDRAAPTFHYFCQLQSRFLEGAEAMKAASNFVEQQPASKERDLALARLYNHEGWLRIRVGEFERAQRILEDSLALYAKHNAAPPPHMGSDSSVPLATIALIQGDSERAVALCESARQAAAVREDKQNLAFAHYGLTAARSSQGDYKTAYQHAESAYRFAQEAGNRWFLAYTLIERGNVARAMGNYEEAKEHYQAGYVLKEEFEAPEGMAVALSHLGDIAVQQERYQEAEHLFEKSLDLYSDINDRGGLATCLHGLGKVAHATQDLSAACERFRHALQIAAEIHFWPLVCSIIVDVAALMKSLNQTALSVTLLSLIRIHPSSDHETRHLVQQQLEAYEAQMQAENFTAAVQQCEEMELDQALEKIHAELASIVEKASTSAQQEQPLIEPLTDRELDVLRLIAKGYQNAEIAEELVLALGTVKWYANQIYQKLGVSNRTEAANRARDLDLLP